MLERPANMKIILLSSILYGVIFRISLYNTIVKKIDCKIIIAMFSYQTVTLCHCHELIYKKTNNVIRNIILFRSYYFEIFSALRYVWSHKCVQVICCKFQFHFCWLAVILTDFDFCDAGPTSHQHKSTVTSGLPNQGVKCVNCEPLFPGALRPFYVNPFLVAHFLVSW